MPGVLGAGGTPYAVILPPDQGDAVTRAKMLRLMERAGVQVEETTRSFTVGGVEYPGGTYVIRLAQVYGRYAKEMLETQVYPEVRLAPDLPPLPPYDVTAWSLGLQMGVGVAFVDHPFEASLRLVDGVPLPSGGVEGRGDVYLISPESNDAFSAVNRLWNEGAQVRRASNPVFSDVVLPGGMDGVQLAIQARALRSEIPVLFTSGYAEQSVLKMARQLPDFELIPKPFDSGTLAWRLRAVLIQSQEVDP